MKKNNFFPGCEGPGPAVRSTAAPQPCKKKIFPRGAHMQRSHRLFLKRGRTAQQGISYYQNAIEKHYKK